MTSKIEALIATRKRAEALLGGINSVLQRTEDTVIVFKSQGSRCHTVFASSHPRLHAELLAVLRKHQTQLQNELDYAKQALLDMERLYDAFMKLPPVTHGMPRGIPNAGQEEAESK